uniref:Uncharacterized protein n=1 Tax=Proboscia inermis TaxID=420281 RepID=A0A7S0CFB9_9STRA
MVFFQTKLFFTTIAFDAFFFNNKKSVCLFHILDVLNAVCALDLSNLSTKPELVLLQCVLFCIVLLLLSNCHFCVTFFNFTCLSLFCQCDGNVLLFFYKFLTMASASRYSASSVLVSSVRV